MIIYRDECRNGTTAKGRRRPVGETRLRRRDASRQRDFVWKIHMEWWDSLTIILWGNSWGYPLVNVKKKLWKITILNGKFNYINSTISAGPFSIAMLVYHRVIVGHHFMGIHWG